MAKLKNMKTKNPTCLSQQNPMVIRPAVVNKLAKRKAVVNKLARHKTDTRSDEQLDSSIKKLTEEEERLYRKNARIKNIIVTLIAYRSTLTDGLQNHSCHPNRIKSGPSFSDAIRASLDLDDENSSEENCSSDYSLKC